MDMSYERMTVRGYRNVWILWLKVLAPEVDQREHAGRLFKGFEKYEGG